MKNIKFTEKERNLILHALTQIGLWAEDHGDIDEKQEIDKIINKINKS